MMKPKFALSHDFLSVHHEYFVGTFASILLCPPTFKCLATLLTVTLLNNQAKPIKIRLLLFCQFYKVVDEEKIFTDSHFSTKNEVVTESTDLSEIYNIANERLTELLENFQRNGSGWIFDKVLHFEIITNEFRPLRGSSFIKLPKSLANKRAIINPKNEDAECFKWCVTEAVYPQSKNRGRITKKSKKNAELFNWEGTEFPMNLKKIGLFEENNPNYAVNVLGYEEEKTGIFPLRISAYSSTRTVVNLLMISEEESLKQHYVIIQDISRLVCNQVDHHNGKTHICLNCMNPFHSEERLKSHKEHCDNNDAVRIEVPNADKEKANLSIQFGKYIRKLKVPFVIYADFESFTEKIEQRKDCELSELRDRLTEIRDRLTERLDSTSLTLSELSEKFDSTSLTLSELSEKLSEQTEKSEAEDDKSYTRKYQKHTPSGFCFFIAYRGGLYKKPVVFSGDNVAEEFCKQIEKETREIYDTYLEKSKHKPIRMTQANETYFKKTDVCHICESTISKDSKNNYKVKDHDHLTGKFRGPAHNTCNLKFKEPNFIPVVFHNLSGYDAHLFVKQLGVSEEI